MPKIVDRSIFLNAVREMLGEDIVVCSRDQVLSVCEKYDLKYPTWLTNNPEYRSGRGMYRISDAPNNYIIAEMSASVVPLRKDVDVNTSETVSLVPNVVSGYVQFGHFNDVRTIIKSERFYPLFVTGLSGNGKTMMVEQVCAHEKRECIRVNITIETDDDDLIGGFRLENGRTVWHNGPVIQAMQRGAVLLLDEIDLGSNKMMCLQPVLEGKAIYLKKTGEMVHPSPGFNVVATANTKGKGSDDGRYIGANVLNDAFLERFSVTLEQEYPPVNTETKILTNIITDNEFVTKLVAWADIIRKSFHEGAVSEIISTRRLVHICEAYNIFNHNREKAIQLCLNRFDVDTKTSFMDLYKKMDETINPLVSPTVY